VLKVINNHGRKSMSQRTHQPPLRDINGGICGLKKKTVGVRIVTKKSRGKINQFRRATFQDRKGRRLEHVSKKQTVIQT